MEFVSAEELCFSYAKKNTRQAVISSLKSFMDFVYGARDLSLSIKYLQEVDAGTRKPEVDVRDFVVCLSEELSGRAVHNYVNYVIFWLDVNDVKFKTWQLRQIRKSRPEKFTETIEDEMNKDKLLKMYECLSDVSKVLFMIMESSGSRLSETCSIRAENVFLQESPARIRLSGNTTKNGHTRDILISKECADIVCSFIGDMKKGRVFSSNAAAAFGKEWRKIEAASGNYDLIRGRRRFHFHPHMLRKWFISQFTLHGNKDVAEMLAGHNGYLSDAYRRYSREEVAAEYLKAEKALSLFEQPKFSSCCLESAYYEC